MCGSIKKTCVLIFAAGTTSILMLYAIIKWDLRVEITWNGMKGDRQVEGLQSPVQKASRNTSSSLQAPALASSLSDKVDESITAVTTNLHNKTEKIHRNTSIPLPGWHMQEFTNATNLNDLPIYMGFQPEYEAEFPSVPSAKVRIPHIIHQIWINTNNKNNKLSVPTQFVPNIRSIMEFNPGWKYILWTHTYGKNLIKKKYPKLLKFFNSISEAVTKADLLRYVVIHEYGGIYADLDVTCLRNLDIVTRKYACILVPAPFENSVMALNWPYHICNGIIFCRSRHPLFRQVIDSMAIVDIHLFHTLSFGPQFFTEEFRNYSGINDMYKIDTTISSTSPYFYKGNISETDKNGMYIPNTRFFLDQPDPRLEKGVLKLCRSQTELNDIQERMCHNLRSRGFYRKSGTYTFLTHSYSATFHAGNKKNLKSLTPVADIIHSINKQLTRQKEIK